MVSALKKISGFLTKLMRIAMIALFIWMVAALGIQVFARYVFNTGFVWTDESARYCMIWMIFIGATEVVFNDDHIKVTIVEDLVRGVGKRIVLLVQDVVCLLFSILLAYYSFPQMALASKAVSANMDINMGIVYAIFPVVTILMAVGYLFRIVLVFADREKGGVRA